MSKRFYPPLQTPSTASDLQRSIDDIKSLVRSNSTSTLLILTTLSHKNDPSCILCNFNSFYLMSLNQTIIKTR